MKLKLELQDGVTVLRVTEEVESAHVAILRAGLMKIFATDTSKKGVVLDLCEAKLVGEGTESSIAQLRGSLPVPDAVLVIASPVSSIAHTATVSDALKQLASGATAISNAPASAEARLRQRLAQLEAHKASIMGRSTAGITDAQFMSLRRDNSDLKRSVRGMESLITQVLSKRIAIRAVDPRTEQIKKSLEFILQQQALLPTT